MSQHRRKDVEATVSVEPGGGPSVMKGRAPDRKQPGGLRRRPDRGRELSRNEKGCAEPEGENEGDRPGQVATVCGCGC